MFTYFKLNEKSVTNDVATPVAKSILNIVKK